jgi:hypothetical protein
MGREAVQAVVAKMKGETIHAVIDSGTVVVLHPPNRARRPCEPANANQSQTSGVPSLTPPIVLVLVVVLVLVFRVSLQTQINLKPREYHPSPPQSCSYSSSCSSSM